MVIYVPPVKEMKFTLMKVKGGGGVDGGIFHYTAAVYTVLITILFF